MPGKKWSPERAVSGDRRILLFLDSWANPVFLNRINFFKLFLNISPKKLEKAECPVCRIAVFEHSAFLLVKNQMHIFIGVQMIPTIYVVYEAPYMSSESRKLLS